MGAGDTQEASWFWCLGALSLLTDVYPFGGDTALPSPVLTAMLRHRSEALSHPGGRGSCGLTIPKSGDGCSG